MNNYFKKITIWLLIIYLLLCVGFYLSQGLFFFHPKKLEADYAFNFSKKIKETPIVINAEKSYDVVRFETDLEKPKGVVLYFHGNQENINHYEKYSTNFTKNGWECWMIDYPTYGKSTGDLNEENLKQTAEEVYKMAAGKFKKDSIIIYGKSMGTGIAAYLASRVESKMMILETPYLSLQELFTTYIPGVPVSKLLKINFNQKGFVDMCNEPIVIFHGTQDEVIPFTQVVQLANHLKPGDKFVPIIGGTHNDLPEKIAYKNELDSLLN